MSDKKQALSLVSLIREMILDSRLAENSFPRIRVLESKDEVYFLLEPSSETVLPDLENEDPDVPYLRLYRSLANNWVIGHVDNVGFEGMGYGIQLYLVALEYVFPNAIVSTERSHFANIAHEKLRKLGVKIEIDPKTSVRKLSGGPGSSFPTIKESHV